MSSAEVIEGEGSALTLRRGDRIKINKTGVPTILLAFTLRTCN